MLDGLVEFISEAWNDQCILKKAKTIHPVIRQVHLLYVLL